MSLKSTSKSSLRRASLRVSTGPAQRMYFSTLFSFETRRLRGDDDVSRGSVDGRHLESGLGEQYLPVRDVVIRPASNGAKHIDRKIHIYLRLFGSYYRYPTQYERFLQYRAEKLRVFRIDEGFGEISTNSLVSNSRR
uniref:Uncharacterized protein n=1 Tax=Candidatus Kentrum sp. TC TaxID=2126339 RepID=A0A450YN18_9GAMM|nr:MAG: hypothetical protein BECKTC1821E_GA0114239_102219 [Candidatus Kentron sp. TC]